MITRFSSNLSDAQFLEWIHDRLHYVHGENINVDYMHRLRAIIKSQSNQVEKQ